MSQDTELNNLIINKLTREQYQSIENPDPTQLYLTPSDEVEWGNISGDVFDQPDLVSYVKQTDGLPKGFVGNFADIYNSVYNMKHSTFDLSKFTVVGSPNITNDGIASGFSSSNYLTFALNNSTSQNWEMEFIIKTPANNSIIENYNAIISRSSTAFQLYCAKSIVTSVVGYWYIELGENKILQTSLYWNTNYKLSIVNHNGIITLNILNLDTNNTDSISAPQTYEIYLNGTWRLGLTQSGNFGFQGSIDLKQFSITVDGVPVFSGNQTGIDTIKPDDYTVVGTPTISADGIASGFSSSNYLTKNLDIDLSKNVIIKARIIVSSLGGYPINYGNAWANGIHFEMQTSGLAIVNISDNSSTIRQLKSSVTYSTGDTVAFELRCVNNGLSYECDFYKNGVFDHTDILANPLETPIIPATKEFILGKLITTSSTGVFTGSIDLNAFKIYIDGNLVYQPCLKIPYTEILQGGKVSNAIYRDRVIDAYEQNFVNYDYFTIDEDNQNYTLPQGNMYSLIEAKRVDNPINTVGIDAVNQYKGLNTGSVSENPVVYPEILEKKYSTFDISKFAVVGSPNITNNGITSGFSSSNYLNIGNTVSYTNFIGHSFKITCGFTHKSTTANTNQALFQMYRGNAPQSVRTYNDKVVCSLSTSAYSERTLTPTLVDGNFYTVTLEHDKTTSKYTLSLYDNNNVLLGSDDTFTTGDLVFEEFNYSHFYIGLGVSITWANQGSIDLKQFSITVDGVEVFSGNKTGIDTIKSDDYTVVGTPTISDDGVASGFDMSKYLTISQSTMNNIIGKPFKIEWEDILPTIMTSPSYYVLGEDNWGTGTYQTMVIGNINANGNFFAAMYDTDAVLHPCYIQGSILNNNLRGNKYKGIFEFNGTNTITLTMIFENGQSYTVSKAAETNYIVKTFTAPIKVGYKNEESKLNLNAFKIYVDGNLIYQPCLKIPYTEIKDGGKIVNATYRDRVIDVHEQNFVSYDYFTIDEENQNFTLPQGNLYSIIESKRLSDVNNTVDIDTNSQYNALETGNISNNPLVYNQVVQRRYSTFDRSKFTVVGSPVITSDGIASGLSGSNYLLKSNIDITGNKVVFEGNFTWNGTNPSGSCFLYTFKVSNENTKFALYQASNGKIALHTTISGTDYYNFGDVTISANSPVYYTITLTSSSLGMKVVQNGVEIYNLVKTEHIPTFTTNSTLLIGGITNRAIEGIFDLKQFSITVDGVEVFSGNRTGIDTIKPDDYQVVGAPTISADGIASGFSSSNYLRTPIIDLSKPFSIKAKYTTGTMGVGSIFVFGAGDKNYIRFTSSSIMIYLNELSLNATTSTALQSNTTYDIEFLWTGTKYVFNAYNLDGTLYSTVEVSSSTACANFAVKMGYSNWDASVLNGSIDLNSFKIYVDGNLVYQPCLKIPYTESKTGSKIVDSIYRDRVNDMAEQFGFANYYTLDEGNGNFTLPKTELYGDIQQMLREHEVDGVDKKWLYSNRTLVLTGSCTENVEVNLGTEFADTNYIVTVPYQAGSKTTSSFIPTQTGDWIAIGEGVLK